MPISQLRLPFPTIPEYSQVSKETTQAFPVTLRLQGSHVLAGLRNLVQTGQDQGSEANTPGLPAWLTEIRGTRVSVGLEEGIDD